MAFAIKAFDTLNTGDMFRFLAGAPGTLGVTYRKSGPRSAVMQRDGKDDTTVDGTVKVSRPSVKVSAVVADPVPPTAEELARLYTRRVTNTIEDMVDRAERARKTLATATADPDHNAWYSLMGYYSGVEDQMKAAVGLDVAVTARRILESDDADHGGLEGLKRVAMSHALRYARFGHHSTSAVSNLLEEMKATWWAEILEACGVGR